MTTTARDARLPEEGFHEIQLSAKQLVFLFMATTVVSVVIFLCGVLVGRGVRVEGASGGSTEAAVSASVPGAPGAGVSPVPADAPAGTDQPREPAAPGQAAEEGSDYYGRLMAADAPAETLAPPRDAPPPVADEPSPAVPAAAPVPPAGDTGGFIVQVTALRQRAEAAAVAERLKSRGYKAFVIEPQAGTTPLYRVRVGPFSDRAEADRIMKRLAREEQFTPWLSR